MGAIIVPAVPVRYAETENLKDRVGVRRRALGPFDIDVGSVRRRDKDDPLKHLSLRNIVQ